MDKNFDFSNLQDIQISVTAPDGRKFILRECSGDAYEIWQDAIESCRVYVDGKFNGFRDLSSTASVLLAKCLVETKPDGTLQTVEPNTVRQWPQRMRKKLVEWVKEVSELNEELTEEELVEVIGKLQKRLDELRKGNTPAKNAQGGSQTGSN